MLELVLKMAISQDELPPFLHLWSDLFSPTSMFSFHRMKIWTSPHLCSNGSYFMCSLKLVPNDEQALYDLAENAKDIILFDSNNGSIDKTTRANAIVEIYALDVKKKENLKSLFKMELVKEEARKAKGTIKG